MGDFFVFSEHYETGERSDLTAFLLRLVFRDRIGFGAGSLSLELAGNFPKNTGDRLILQTSSGQTVFSGRIFAQTRAAEKGEMTTGLFALDDRQLLCGDDYPPVLNGSFSGVAAGVFNRVGLSYAISGLQNVTLPKQEDSLKEYATMLESAAEDHRILSGERVLATMNGRKITLSKRQSGSATELSPQKVKRAVFTRFADDTRTRIKLVSKASSEVWEGAKDTAVSRYGVFQETRLLSSSFSVEEMKAIGQRELTRLAKESEKSEIQIKGDWQYRAGGEFRLVYPLIPVTKQLLAEEVVHSVFEGEHWCDLLLWQV